VKPIEGHPDAEAEFHEAVTYYEEQVEGLGAEFREEIREAIERIWQRPQAYPFYEDSVVQEVQVNRFRFVICYVDEPNRIWILAVANQWRRPGYWRRRLRDR
jgi:hypothetical protein